MNKRKRREPAHDNPIIAAIRRSLPGGGMFIFDVDRPPPDRVLDLLAVALLKDATIREIGVIVAKALLTGDRQIVGIVKDALKESNHIFKRDRELILYKKVLKYWPDLHSSGLSVVAIKEKIEKRFNKSKKLEQHEWNRLRIALCLPKLPTGAAASAYDWQQRRKSDTKRRKSLS
jgi:hypothetical protein